MRRMLGLVLALLMVAPLAILPSGGAQGGDGEALYSIEDPRGDVRPFGFNPASPSTPGTTVTDPYDLVAFRILSDDPDALTMQIELADWESSANLNDGALSFGGIYYEVGFQLAGGNVQYVIEPAGSSRSCDVTDCQWRLRSELCVRTSNSSCFWQSVETEFDEDESLITFHVSKRALLALEDSNRRYASADDRPAGVPDHMPAGTVLEGWYVRFEHLGLADDAPDSGTGDPYRVKATSANTKVGVFLAETDEEEQDEYYYGPYYYESGSETGGADSVAVSPGVPTVVPLRVENHAASKRLVNLTVEFPDAEAGKWEAQIAPAVQVPSGETRVVNLILNASSDVQHRENTTLVVDAKSLGHDEEIGYLRLLVEGSVPPSPDANVLHFHARRTTDSPFAFYGGIQMWTNTLDEDPRGTLDGDAYASHFNLLFGGYQWVGNFPMDTELVRPVLFDPDEPVTGSLFFSSDVPFEATATLAVRAVGADTQLGGASVSKEVGAEPTEFPFTFFVNPEDKRVAPEDGPLALFVALDASDFFAPSVRDSVKFYPADSQVTLPLVPDPDAEDVQVSLGPARIGLTLDADTDREEFVNPNRTKLFELVLVNEGVESDTARLNITHAKDAGWQVHVEPAMKYRLAPGESATVGLFVRAPSNATEGEQFKVRVEAVSQKDEDAVTRVNLNAIATKGVDIPDESDAYEADDDTLSNAVPDDEGGDSPGLSVLAAALAAAAALIWTGRRNEKR